MSRGHFVIGLRRIAPMVLFALFAVAATWPLAGSISTRLPLANEEARTVPYFNLWTLAWNIQCVEQGGTVFSSRYWDAPIFFPEQNCLAMSEAQPLTMALAPIKWMTDNHALTYNLYFLLSLTLNGWVTWLVLRRQGIGVAVALAGGIAMLFLPAVHWQAGVLQLVPIWAIVWSIDGLRRILVPIIQRIEARGGAQETSTDEAGAKAISPASEPVSNSITSSNRYWKDGLRLALAVTAVFWMCVHHGVFLVVIFSLSAPLFFVTNFSRETLKSLFLAASVLLCTVGPIAWRHHQVNQQFGFARDHEVVEQLSGQVTDYGTYYGKSMIAPAEGLRPWHLSPGWSKVALGLLGGLLGIVGAIQRKRVLFLLCVGMVSLALSLGTNLQIGDWNIWDFLAGYVPGLAQVRSAYRFCYFVQIVSVLLAAEALHLGWQKRSTLVKPWLKWPLTFLLTAALGWMAMDPWPPSMRLCVLPSTSESWPSKLSSTTDGAVLFLPMLSDGTVRDFEPTAEWMIQLLPTGKAMVNGYSGFFPESNLELARQIATNGMDKSMQKQLVSIGIRYVVVTSSYVGHGDDDWSEMKLLSDPTESVWLYQLPNLSSYSQTSKP